MIDNLATKMHACNYWFAHDIWYTLWAVSYDMLVVLVIWLTVKLAFVEVTKSA